MRNLTKQVLQYEVDTGELENKCSSIMRRNNTLCDDYNEKYAEVDIRYAEFIETISNQRERDLIYISNFFHIAYQSLHITATVMREELNEYNREIVRNVYQALDRIGQSHLLTSGLSTKILKKYIKE